MTTFYHYSELSKEALYASIREIEYEKNANLKELQDGRDDWGAEFEREREM